MNDPDDLKKKDEAIVDRAADVIEEKLSYKHGYISRDLGLCTDCDHLFYIEREFGEIYETVCEDEDWGKKRKTQISHDNPIKRCSKYRKRGELSLWEMQKMALFIDLDKKTISGFAQDDEKKENE